VSAPALRTGDGAPFNRLMLAILGCSPALAEPAFPKAA
jgi:hypothetical protein